MKKLLGLIMGMVLAVYAMPLVTVGPNARPGIAAPDDSIYVSGIDDNTTTQASEPSSEADTTGAEVYSPPGGLLRYDAKTYVTALIDGESVTITLRDYLIGVIAAEMPAGFPIEALKAQAVAARTYTLYKIKLYDDGMEIPAEHMGAQVCDDPAHCKAFCNVEERGAELWDEQAGFFLDRITAAVDGTCGLIAVYDGQPIAAVFHAASGDYTEAAADVWGGTMPYLVSVTSEGGADSPQYTASVKVPKEDFKALVLRDYPDAVFHDDAGQWFKASTRSRAGGIIDVAVGGVRVSGVYLRTLLGLNSTNFKVKLEAEDLIFSTQGYGHGVGMSQYGARAMALEGKTFDEIIKHYFSGVELMLKS